MFAIEGVYDGTTNQLKMATIPGRERYKVIVTFMQPLTAPDERQAAFARLMTYSRTLPADFDYKKEIAAYREERYGRSD
ncbi:hypothetical protein FACS1894139_06470 [Planctomycetales bacterium]|nr:hypothetical protein FACS1894107_03800 [Planctomycetales bacterium]GHT00738.1 hypothetical protein FACS1894108_13510 [Planctomycetales bacterium]GHT04400.1 hypothetical protein FACS1894139_06470 [Planctomycetales bacterium]GHV23164.1 hypothetical protein AGMMS49959_15430 [Planctomycetales bacterium]